MKTGHGSIVALSRLYSESLAIFNEMILWNDAHIDGHSRRAEVATATGDLKTSIESYSRIIALGGETVNVRMMMGTSYFVQKKFKYALQEFENSLELYYKNEKNKNTDKHIPEGENSKTMILSRIGKAYKELGEPLKSVKVLRDALELGARSKEILMDLAAVLMEYGI